MIEKWLTPFLQAFGAPGREEAVSAVVQEALVELGVGAEQDALGNVLASSRAADGESPLLVCNMDVPGALLCQTADGNSLQFEPLGRFEPSDWAGQVVVTDLGNRGLVVKDSDTGPGDKERPRLRVELGFLSDAGEAGPPADRFAVAQDYGGPTGPRAGLDNRLGCAVALEVLQQANRDEKPLRVAFTVQEQLRGRGCNALSARLQAPEALVLAPVLGEGPRTGEGAQLRPGKGPVVQVRRGSFVCHHRLVQTLEECATQASVGLQRTVDEHADPGAAGVLQLSGTGAAVAVLGPILWPPRCPQEFYAGSDVDQMVRLLREYLRRF